MLHADDAFLDHYGFAHDPFAARVPGMKFFPAQRKTVLSQLHHLARYSQLMLLVSGPEGSGKTLLRKALAGSANKDSVKCVVLSGRGLMASRDVLMGIAQGLGGTSSDLEEVFEHIEQLALTGQELYLLVDEADDLPDELLPLLFTLADGQGQARPHVFLFGTAALAARLERLAGDQERFHPITLAPYEYEDTCEYLAQRLKAAGADLDIFSEEQLEHIHEESGGWPGLINQVAREAAIDAMQDGQDAPEVGRKARFPIKHLAMVAVVALGVGAAWFMQGKSGDDVVATQSSELTLPPVTPVVEATVEPVAANPEPTLAEVSEPAQQEPQVQFDGVAQPLPLPVPTQPIERSATPAPVEVASAPESAPAVVEPSAAPVAAPVVAAKPVVEPAPKAQEPAKPVAPPVAKPVAAPVSVVAGEGHEGWYAAQAGGQYALQVSALSSAVAAKAVVAKEGAQFRFYRKLVSGKPMFVVTYGQFATALEAKQAVAKLPAQYQRNKPWPKRFADIQREIRASR